MNTWFDYLVEVERRRDEIARAEKENRLARALRSEHEKPRRRPRRHEVFLASVGDRLVAWGCRLQARYRHVAENRARLGTDPLVIPRRGRPWSLHLIECMRDRARLRSSNERSLHEGNAQQDNDGRPIRLLRRSGTLCDSERL